MPPSIQDQTKCFWNGTSAELPLFTFFPPCFFLLLAVTAIQKKGHLLSNRNEERLSLCVLYTSVCVCAPACWDGMGDIQCVPAQELFTVLNQSSDAYKIFSRLEGTSLEGAKPQMDMLGSKCSVTSS